MFKTSMMETSTTNPARPSGITPTEVPLGITSSTVPVPGPSELVIKSLKCFQLVRPIYHSSFQIANTNNVGERIFNYDSTYPLGDFPNRYNTIAGSNDTSRPLVPWTLLKPYYSRMCRIEFEIHLLPVKVADSRVSLDVISTYDVLDGPYAYNSINMSNDTFHKHLDSQDDELVIQVPTYWMSKFIQTDSSYVSVTGVQTVLQPAFIPTTQLEFYIRGRYHNSMIQPSAFNVLVTVLPTVVESLQIAGKSNVSATFPDLWSQTPAPWFLHSSVN